MAEWLLGLVSSFWTELKLCFPETVTKVLWLESLA